MSNPYKAPDAVLTSPGGGPPSRRAVLMFGLVSTGAVATLLSLLVPQFDRVLTSFGADLPWLTRAVSQLYLAAWLLPVSVATVWFRWPNPKQRAGIVRTIGVLSLLVLLPVCLIALYLPIFELAAVM
jgi:hypothetical protein